ncbi:hypothetical protein IAE22_32715 [Bacillus sp. S34]|nr:hypothetical protein [Bacillus sp. S34]
MLPARVTDYAPSMLDELTAEAERQVRDRELAAAEAAAPGTHMRLDVTEETPEAWRLYERRGWCMTGRGPADWSKPSGEVPTVRYYAKRVG